MTSQELYDYAVSRLAKRDYASGELMRVLNKLTEDREDIDKALSRLVECGYLTLFCWHFCALPPHCPHTPNRPLPACPAGKGSAWNSENKPR